MEVKVSFDRDKLMKWFDEDCEIECEKCPFNGYMCENILLVAYAEYLEKAWEDNKKNNK